MSSETIIKAKTFWDPKENRTSFEEDLAFHLATPHGVVFSFGDSLLFARPVRMDRAKEWETYTSWPLEECSAWYVWLAIGHVDKLLQLMDSGLASRLPYLIRKKNDKFRLIETDKLRKRVN